MEMNSGKITEQVLNSDTENFSNVWIEVQKYVESSSMWKIARLSLDEQNVCKESATHSV